MTATVASIVSSARYDLRDASSLQFATAELVDYLNRALIQLDNALSAHKSDWVWTEDLTVDLLAAASSAIAPTGTIAIREIWIGTEELDKKDPSYVAYRKQFNQSGRPVNWAHNGANIIFDRAADIKYDLEIYFDKRATALTSGGNMPYADEFNEPLRQMMVLQAKHRNEFDLSIDSQMFNFFTSAVLNNVIRRTYKTKRYRLDF